MPFNFLAVLILIIVGCGTSDNPEQGSEGTDPVETVEPTPTATAQVPDPTSSPTQSGAGSDVPRAEPPDVQGAQASAFVDGLNSFAVDLYHAVTEQDDGNLIYSPASIELAFSMVYAGARGETEAQLADVLGFLPQEDQHPAANAIDAHLNGLGEDPPSPGTGAGEPFQLTIANAVWGQDGYPFEDTFLQTLAEHYGAGMRTVDFERNAEAARQLVNDWVAERTEGRIEDAVPEGTLDAMTRLVLANAIYFKAGWLFPFDTSATTDGNFTLLDGSQVTAQMMHHRAARVPYVAGEGYQTVRLPYTGETVEMVVIVPDEGRYEEIEAGLDAEFLRQARAGAVILDVTLTMPRFDFESELDLAAILPEMGMPDPFGPADFTGISGTGELFIDAAIHHATIAVDETGTEATAATVIEMAESEMERAELTIDRPFIFAILDRETGATLFLGRVMDPSS